MQYRQPLVAVACALLVVTAGCATFTSDEAESTTDQPTTGQPTTEPATTGQPTTEPATTGTEPATATGTTDAGTSEPVAQLPPGLTTDGVTNALALANAHRATLKGSPFVKHSSLERSNATASAFRRTTLRYANESYWLWNITTDGMPLALGTRTGSFVSYADGERVVYRLQAEGRVRHNVRQISMRADAPPVPPEDVLPESVYARNLIYTVLSYGNLTVERADDATYRLTGTADQVTVRGQTVTNVEFEANVTADGLFRTIDLTYERGNTSVERRLAFEKVDENPVERPDWYETALNQTSSE